MLNRGQLIALKRNPEFLERQKFAGSVVAKAHQRVFELMHNRTEGLTIARLGEEIEKIITSANCQPTFLGYRGFPSVACASLNKEIVHGFCNRKTLLKEGDVLKIDIGATNKGSIADCAVTYVYGKPKTEAVAQLLLSCQGALKDAIAQVKVGNTIGQLSKAIYDRSRKDGFGVITLFGGHGICVDTLHAPPFIPNKGKETDGVHLQPGMAIAIEPMFVIGSNTKTKILTDKWTVVTKEVGAHFEHSVTLDADGNRHIITEHGIEAQDMI